ncbi:MAG TPA: hypothetical protein VK631_24300, partial [Solirubrobacteraceae bacterium]|nr:hypothetical protein [Solirubrobacteraceae bacterium]
MVEPPAQARGDMSMVHGTLTKTGRRRLAIAATAVLLGALGAVTNAASDFTANTVAAAAPECGSPVVAGTTATVTCSYTGAAQQWTVPAGVTSATFDVFGAQGGGYVTFGVLGGLGGRAVASLNVTPGEVLEVYVGGTSGFGGGGDPGSMCVPDPSGGSVCVEVGFEGGGASDVRRTPHGLG